MISRSRRRKLTPAEFRIERLRIARLSAPLLRELQPDAAQVSIQLTFANDMFLSPTTRRFTVHPPAQAYFVYACAFGDCDGMHDLNDVVHGLLRTGESYASGSRRCAGQKRFGVGQHRDCGLGLTYTVTVLYLAARLEKPWQPVAAA